MKKFLLSVGFIVSSVLTFGQASDLFISEYAEGSSNNKYIEIYNGTGDTVDLSNYALWRISNGGTWFEDSNILSGQLPHGEVIVAANSAADTAILNLSNATTAYNTSTFFNGDDAVGLAKWNGSTWFIIDAVGEQGPDPGSGWDVAGTTNGTGEHTLIRKPWVCGPDTNWAFTAGTNTSNSQWIVAAQNFWDSAGFHYSNCSSLPEYPVRLINNVDSLGVPYYLEVNCWTRGVVVGVDLDGNAGYSFTIMDTLGGTEGINVYNSANVSNYSVQEGDSILIRGEIDFYNGLTEIFPDSIELLNQNNPIPDTVTITVLGEDSESELIKIEDVMITAISGSNYTLSGNGNTYVMRVDSDTDVDDSLSFAIGDSLCYVIGIGGQFDNSSPYTSGYQIFPRYYTDVDTSCGSGSVMPPSGLPIYPIGTIETVDTNGVVDSNSVVCGIQGIVVGVDLQGTSSNNSFTVIDNTGGIGVFASGGFTPPYTVTEGDSVIVYGTVGQFNGLAQINGDSMMVLSSGNALPTPLTVTTLDESTESEYIRMENLTVFDVSGSNYTLVTATDTVVMRVDSDTDVDDSLTIVVGDSICELIGIGGQYDFSSPYTSGYQIFPHHYYDVDICVEDTTTIPEPPFYPIPVINNDDANGEPDSLGVYCWTRGVVLGVDLDGNNGISFTLWDEEGINVWNFNDVSNYVVTEGDSIMVRGEIDFYNGLTEIFPDSIMLINQGNPVPEPMEADVPSQETESEPIIIHNVMVIDTAQWPTSSSSNVDLLTCDGDTIVMRIDTDTDVDENWPSAPTGMFHITGIGGQFDNSAPYLDNYQIFPMFYTDIDTNVSMEAPSLVINELMANNTSAYADENGDFDDWIEVYNTGNNAVSLAGLYFTNDALIPMLYQVPTTSTEVVPAGGYAIIWADNEDSEGDLHTNFTLDETGGFVGIAYEMGCDVAAVDSVTYVALGSDESFGRNTDGGAPWVVFTQTTPNSANFPLSVEEVSVKGLKAWPNPNNGEVLRLNKQVSFTLYNLTGQVVLQQQRVTTTDLSGLTDGLYLLETSEGESLRVIVQ